jgi:hypothetical protein
MHATSRSSRRTPHSKVRAVTDGSDGCPGFLPERALRLSHRAGAFSERERILLQLGVFRFGLLEDRMPMKVRDDAIYQKAPGVEPGQALFLF